MAELTPRRTPADSGRCSIPAIWLGALSLALGYVASSDRRIVAEESAVRPQAAGRIDRTEREIELIEMQIRARLLEPIIAARDNSMDEVDDLAVSNGESVESASGGPAAAFDELFFGPGSEQAAFRRRSLDQILQQKLRTIAWVCRLNDVQKRKLELAGRGDMQRFFDRVEGQRTLYINGDVGTLQRIGREVGLLYLTMRSGLHEEGSLFDKTLANALTADQSARLRLIQAVQAAGGTIQKRLQGMEELAEIRLSAVGFTDSDLAGLADLTDLQVFALDGSQVTDAGLVSLRDMKNLRNLNLARTQVSDTGLVNLQEMRSLLDLDLTNTLLTDAGLTRLGNFMTLQNLYLSGTRVTDGGLESLVGLTKLRVLHLGQTRITDAGVANLQLANMKQMTDLGLEGTLISDVALAQLEDMSRLQKLNLACTKVSDAGLIRLSRLPSLKYLVLTDTQVTPSGVARLQQALPGLKIAK